MFAVIKRIDHNEKF